MDQALSLAIDVGGTKAEAALIDSRGMLVAGSRFREPTGGGSSEQELADAVSSVARAAAAALPRGATLLGVGIGAAGPIQQELGLVSPLNLPAWRNYPLRDVIAELFPAIPVTLRMDGQCIALAEHWVGAGVGFANVMGMIVSTGVGGGLILGGHTVSGPTGNAGHIGHVEVAGFDTACACGGRGCLEAVASGPRSVAWAKTQGWQGHTGEDLAAGYRNSDPIAIAAIARAGTAIGQAIASATALTDLELVAIGGGFSHATPDLFDHIRTAIAARTEFGFVTKVRVVPSALSGDGPLIGAGALIHRADYLD